MTMLTENANEVSIGGFVLTEHARQRMRQRAIQPWMVEVALRWGKVSYDRGCVTWTVTDRSLERTPFEQAKERLRGLCVVADLSEGAIVTVKWVHRLRHRPPRRLAKNFAPSRRKKNWVLKAP